MSGEDKSNEKIIILEEHYKCVSGKVERLERDVNAHRELSNKLANTIFGRLRVLEISNAKYSWVPVLVSALVASLMLYGWEHLRVGSGG